MPDIHKCWLPMCDRSTVTHLLCRPFGHDNSQPLPSRVAADRSERTQAHSLQQSKRSSASA